MTGKNIDKNIKLISSICGFLGAGAIIRRGEGGVVKGLTTAATIWVTAGIGLAAGAGMYILATVTTLLVLVVLLMRRRVE